MIIIAEGVEGVERDTASAYLICIPTSRGMWRRNGVRSFRTARIPRIRPFRDFVACSTTIFNYTGSSFHRCCNDLSSRRYGINLAPFLPFSSRVLPVGSIVITDCIRSPRFLVSRPRNGAWHNLSRASHIFFRESKIETDEKPHV